MEQEAQQPESLAERAKKRFVGRKKKVQNEEGETTGTGETAVALHPRPRNSAKKFNAIPEDILENPDLNSDIAAALPKNYNFEIHKSIHQLRKFNVKKVALQFPEGMEFIAVMLA